jgi:hypothetical protein
MGMAVLYAKNMKIAIFVIRFLGYITKITLFFCFAIFFVKK